MVVLGFRRDRLLDQVWVGTGRQQTHLLHALLHLRHQLRVAPHQLLEFVTKPLLLLSRTLLRPPTLPPQPRLSRIRSLLLPLLLPARSPLPAHRRRNFHTPSNLLLRRPAAHLLPLRTAGRLHHLRNRRLGLHLLVLLLLHRHRLRLLARRHLQLGVAAPGGTLESAVLAADATLTHVVRRGDCMWGGVPVGFW
jgi:hypothetical protein